MAWFLTGPDHYQSMAWRLGTPAVDSFKKERTSTGLYFRRITLAAVWRMDGVMGRRVINRLVLVREREWKGRERLERN